MAWSPISKDELTELMAPALSQADDTVRAAWERIRIEPEKWRCSPWGDSGGGFWAVAVRGDRVIWFNDIEDGFNTSRFREVGVIDEYQCNQSDFLEVLSALPEAMTAAAFATQRPTSTVPHEADGRGRVGTRQTTYWVLQPESRPVVRVHFSGKREVRYVAADYESVDLLDDHPVLQEYDESWSSLFVSNAERAPRDAIGQLRDCVVETSGGWRGLEDYGRVAHVSAVLRAGHGRVVNAPLGLIRRMADVLAELGAEPSIVGTWKERGGGTRPRVLLLGRNFVVADAFRFEGQF